MILSQAHKAYFPLSHVCSCEVQLMRLQSLGPCFHSTGEYCYSFVCSCRFVCHREWTFYYKIRTYMMSISFCVLMSNRMFIHVTSYFNFSDLSSFPLTIDLLATNVKFLPLHDCISLWTLFLYQISPLQSTDVITHPIVCILEGHLRLPLTPLSQSFCYSVFPNRERTHCIFNGADQLVEIHMVFLDPVVFETLCTLSADFNPALSILFPRIYGLP